MRATDVPKHHTVSPGGSTAPGPCLRGGRAQGRHPQWEIGCQPWLWTGKQRPREGEQLAQGHTPGEKQTRDASPEPHPGTGTLVLHEALTSAGPAGPGARPAQSEAPSPAPRAAGQRACHCADEAEGPGGSLRPSFLLTVAGTFTATHGKPQRRPRRPLQAASVATGRRGARLEQAGPARVHAPHPVTLRVSVPLSRTQGARPRAGLGAPRLPGLRGRTLPVQVSKSVQSPAFPDACSHHPRVPAHSVTRVAAGRRVLCCVVRPVPPAPDTRA